MAEVTKFYEYKKTDVDELETMTLGKCCREDISSPAGFYFPSKGILLYILCKFVRHLSHYWSIGHVDTRES